MASNRCPSCKSKNTWPIDGVSKNLQVSYYGCEVCPHVWATFADGRPIHHVTPLGAYKLMTQSLNPFKQGKVSIGKRP